MPEAQKEKPSEKPVDIDTSGPAVEVDVAEPKDESVVETESQKTDQEPVTKEEAPKEEETVREIKKEQ